MKSRVFFGLRVGIRDLVLDICCGFLFIAVYNALQLYELCLPMAGQEQSAKDYQD